MHFSERGFITEVDHAEPRKTFLHDFPRNLHRPIFDLRLLDVHALRPAPQKSREAANAIVALDVTGEPLPRHPSAVAEIYQRFENDLAHDADRARIAMLV